MQAICTHAVGERCDCPPPPTLDPSLGGLIATVSGRAAAAGPAMTAAAEALADDAEAPAESLAVPTYAGIAPLDTRWLWQRRIPRGELTVIAGEGGVSKGQLLIDLAARVTTGRPMPLSETPGTPGSVILVTPEDDLAETVAWRLRAAGADLARVHDLTYLGLGAPFELSAAERREGNIAQLREAVETIGDVQLVIIDPLMACIAAGTIATNLGARRVLAPLQRLARETGAAVVVSHHTVKSGAIAGSKGLIDTARLVYRVSKDPENAAIRVMSLEKCNVLGATEDVRYTITGDGHDAHVTWLSRDELAARRTRWRDRQAGRLGPAAGTAVATFAAAWSVRHPGQAPEVHPIEGAWPTLEAAQGACQASATQPLAWQPSTRRAGCWTATVYPSGPAGSEVSFAVSAAGR